LYRGAGGVRCLGLHTRCLVGIPSMSQHCSRSSMSFVFSFFFLAEEERKDSVTNQCTIN
jgi:hypothetical protein